MTGVRPAARSLPVTLVTSIDGVLRDAVALGALADVPGVVVVRHDLSEVADGVLRRVVSDAAGLVEDTPVALEHACRSCALREDTVPLLERLAADGRWGAAVLALPRASEPLPVVRALTLGVGARDVPELVHLAGVVCVVDGASAVRDVVGTDTLAERYLAHGPGDERTVGEVLAHQLRGADLVLATGTHRLPPAARARAGTLLRHLTPPAALRLAEVEDVPGGDLLTARHRPAASALWDDPRHVCPSGTEDRHGVWTLDLADWRPLHPGRFMDRLEELACGALVGRGRFWLPTRPSTVGTWDGAGGQLSIGSAGAWAGRRPSTRLVITGVGEDRVRVRRAFEECLLTDGELARGLPSWAGQDDGFDDWLADDDPQLRPSDPVDGDEGRLEPESSGGPLEADRRAEGDWW